MTAPTCFSDYLYYIVDSCNVAIVDSGNVSIVDSCNVSIVDSGNVSIVDTHTVWNSVFCQYLLFPR